MHSDLVSIVTPSYNSNRFISDTIQSVLDQTHKNWELIIVDDASKDNTCEIVNRFIKNDSRIKLIKLNQNFGAGVARNKAIHEAKGAFIAFLDADDLWKPYKLEKQLEFMETYKLSFTFSSYDQINEKGVLLHKQVKALTVLNYRKLLRCNYVGNLTGIYSVAALGKIYMPKIRKRQDWVLWMRVIEKSGETKGIQESLAYYRIRKDSMSANKINLIKYNYNFYRKGLNFATLKSVFYLILFLVEYFFVKSKQTRTIQ